MLREKDERVANALELEGCAKLNAKRKDESIRAKLKLSQK